MCKALVGRTRRPVETVSEKDLKRAVYELCWQAIKGSIKIDNVVNMLTDLQDLSTEVPSLFADVLSVMDVEIICSEDKDFKEKFMTLIQSCQALVPEAILKERLDQDTLENMGLLVSKQAFQAKYVKVKTRLFYKQQKFNLLREESEGYSKLITELNQRFGPDITPPSVLENIKSLVGCFNLDPNRVLDIILETFECRTDQDTFFVPLIRLYCQDRDTLCHVLGFKFQFYQQTQDSVTPASLYKVAALMLYHGLLDLDTLYPHLSPADDDIQQQHKKDLQEAKEYVRKLNVVVLADKPDKDKEKDDKKMEQPPINNQKLGLCEALIMIGSWTQAKTMMDRFPPFFAMCHPPIAQAMCTLVGSLIEPLYVKYSGLASCLMNRRKKCHKSENRGVANVSTFKDFVAHVVPILTQLGPHLSTDPVLMVKLLRLCKTAIAKPDSCGGGEDVFRGFLTVLNEVILPSISLLPCNCCMSEEVWGVLRLLKYEYRYRLYGQWKNDSHLNHAKLIKARADCADKARYIMKRLAKENVKPLGRQLGKLSHSNPGVLFEYLLSQIQKYDNFIGPVVDSLKYLTSLSYDMLAYCIIEALANPERERMKTDDTNISLWLQSLASFSGAVLKKYQIDLAGIVQYVANQLKAGKSYDMLILREVVQKMAGVEVSEEVTEDQLEAMTGGELLKQEGGYFSQVRNTKKSSNRLKDAMLEQNLSIALCLLMAQQRHAIIFGINQDPTVDRRPLKLVGKLYDQCQDTFVQFVTFLSTQMSYDEFNRRLPAIDELMSTYHIGPECAFSLWRGNYNDRIHAKCDELRKAEKKDKSVSNSQSAKSQRYIEASQAVMKPVQEMLQPLHPPGPWDELTLQLFTTFWSLTMYDLCVPTAAYEKRTQQLKSQISGIEDNLDLTMSKKKKEKERCNSLIDKLRDEEKKQQDHVQLVMARLKHEKDTWFISRSQKQAIITCLLQQCVFPRCVFTASDAVFSARILYVMHNLKTPNFSSLVCYDRIFSNVMWGVPSCTENEAHRFGRFLCTVFNDIMRWHSDKNIYEKECSGFPGFVTVFRAPTTKPSQVDQLDFENYRHVVNKWHFTLTRATVQYLESGNFIQIRNAIIVLTKILPHYPRISRLGLAVERRIDKVCQEQKETRPDLFALAMGYSGLLKSKKRTWVAETDFHKKEQVASETNKSGSSSNSSGKISSNSNSKANESSSNGRKEVKKEVKREKDEEAMEVDKPVNGDTNKRNDSRQSERSSSKSSSDKTSNSHETKSTERSKERSKESKSRDKSVNDGGGDGKSKESKTALSADEKSKKDKKRSSKEKEKKEDKEERQPKEVKNSELIKEDKERRAREDDEPQEKIKDKHRDEARDVKKEKRKEEEKEVKSKYDKDKHKDHKEKERSKKTEKSSSKEKEKVREREREHHMSIGTTPPVSGHILHRRSAEPSPKRLEDRDIKRRKVETTGSKESPHSQSSHHSSQEIYDTKTRRSPGHGRSSLGNERDRGDRGDKEWFSDKEWEYEKGHGREKDAQEDDWEFERERDERPREKLTKGDRKRVSAERSDDRDLSDHKRRKATTKTTSSSVNGDRSSSQDRNRDRHREKVKVRDEKNEKLSASKQMDAGSPSSTNHSAASSNRKSHKESPDRAERDKRNRSSDKHSKKGKHH